MIKKIIYTFVLLGTLHLTFSAQAEPVMKSGATPPRPTKAINQYINQMVTNYHFNKEKLTKIMDQAQYDPQVIHSITHPFEKKPWNFYRKFFVSQERIDNGVAYWQKHRATLKNVKKYYGVPPNVIVSIIGIESFYGQHAGNYNELNALTTLSFYYPKRNKFFQSELTQYLLLTQHEKLNSLVLKGSYAGALGIPQFMPSSYRRYGVDYSKNQSVNLFTNHFDTIASIANYLKQAGWRPGKPVAVPAVIPGNKAPPKKLISKTAIPKHTLTQLRYDHIRPIKKMPSHLKAALIAMQNTDSTEYWLVFSNFHAIMKYNPRTTYALAVFELSNAINKAYEQDLITKSKSTPPTRQT